MDYMKRMWEASKKIAVAFGENRYTDKDGLVWLGYEGETREEDHWVRTDKLESMSSADMMKKMINELNGWDETPVEDPYEYAVQIITGPRAGELVPLWSDRKDRQDFIDDLYAYSDAHNYKLVKRRKAGRIQDA